MVDAISGSQIALSTKVIAISLTTQFAAAIVSLYSNISHESGLNAIQEAIDNRERKFLSARDVLKMFKCFSNNNYFELCGKLL